VPFCYRLTMYSFVLVLHSWLRWAAIVAGLAAIATTVTTPPLVGAQGRADRWGLVFVITMDVQLLLGLLLYFALSPNTAAIFANFEAALGDAGTRFWVVEHAGTMLFAIVMVHVGRVLARKATTSGAKRTRMLICFIAAMIAMLVATPWPGLPNGRPLFRV
jgi:hypothetical protein